MARWKLVEPHYIHAERDGLRAEWEYKEVSRQTGRESRKKFPVPMFLDPRVDTDWTHRNGQMDGIIVVCDGEGAEPNDIILIKDDKGNLPITPGMLPLDDAAKAISAKYNERVIPIDGEDNQTYSERLLDKWIGQLTVAQSAAQAAPTEVKGLDKVLESMTAMMEQNQQILKTLVGNRRAA